MAAALRGVHCANPGTESGDAEAFIVDHMSTDYRSDAPELNLDAVRGYISDKAV